VSPRGAAPVVGVALLVVASVTLAGVVLLLAPAAPAEPAPRAALRLSVDPATDRIALTHIGGDPLDVRDLRLELAVNGTPLVHQPPVPFFAARGFRSGPTGPFNSGADPRWTPGETASVRLASTNAPAIEPGARVRVTVSVDGQVVARLAVDASRGAIVAVVSHSRISPPSGGEYR
jgi:FlaG/FlaF family flagellin (archaellin)